MRLCYDACNETRIPDWSQLVAGYVDAGCQWSPGAIARAQIHITSSGIDEGNAIDIEPRNANALFLPGWVTRARARGVAYPIAYAVAAGFPGAADGYTLEDCRRAIDNAGIVPPLWWASAYQSRAMLGDTVMTQYALDVIPGYDVSYALDFIPGIDVREDPPDMGNAVAFAYDSTGHQQHKVYFVDAGQGVALYHRVYSNNRGEEYPAGQVGGPALDPAGGLDADIFPGPSGTLQLHVMARNLDRSQFSVTEFYLDLPYDPATSKWSWLGI